MALPGVNPTYQYLDMGAPDGAILGQTTSAKVGFWATTPVVQPTGATQATLTATWVTLSAGSGFGFSSSDQIISVIAAIQAIQTALKTTGFWKGSA